MKFVKIVVSLLLVVCLALPLSACNTKDTRWIARCGDEELAAGIFLIDMISQYFVAADLVEDTTRSPLGQEVDGIPSEQYISENAVQDVKNYFAIEQKYAELIGEVSETDQSDAEISANYQWEVFKDYFEENGISKESVQKKILNDVKYTRVFEAYYDQDGIEEVSDEELKDKMAEEYWRVRYMSFSKFDSQGADLDEEGLAYSKETAEKYLKMLEENEDPIDAYRERRKELTDDETEKEQIDEMTAEDFEEMLRKDDETFSDELKDWLETIPEDTPSFFEDQYGFYVFEKLDVLGSEEQFENLRRDLLVDAREEGFDELVASWAAEMDIEINQASVDRYTAKKLKIS